MGWFDYVEMGIAAVFHGPEIFSLGGISVPFTPVMILFGVLLGIAVGATPGLAGPMAMAISLPLLISAFGFTVDALLPVMGFLIGIMKGSTVGGAVPAILFNTPGTPDSYMTTLDGYPMTLQGRAGKALRISHFSSVTGDTFSDIVLILCAPFLAALVEAYLDFPEKTALLILSLAFIAAIIGDSVGKGVISMGLGLLAAYVGTGEDFYPRLSFGTQTLSDGFPVAATILGVLILGEIFKSIEDLRAERHQRGKIGAVEVAGDQRLHWVDVRRLCPYIFRSAVIGTVIGALPGVGTSLAAVLGYTSGRRQHERAGKRPKFGEGAPEGIAATEAANSAVSGANLIPVLSLGIPGNAAAVFLILAADSIGGFNPGPSVFKFTQDQVNPELVIAFGLFTSMMIANFFNWTIGGAFMRAMGIMTRIPKHILMPIALMLTLVAIYVEETSLLALWITIGFGFLGYLMRRIGMSPLPFVIAFILAEPLEQTARQAYSVTGSNPLFLVSSPVAFALTSLAVLLVIYSIRMKQGKA